LIIDDIQFIGGKEKTEEEFFHTFNALYENNKQIIISSDRPPQAIPTLEERLRSRFEGGFVADIAYPEYEMRVAIIHSKLQEARRQLSENVIDLVAKRVKRNIRELEGVLKKIIFYEEQKGVAVTMKIAEGIIEKAVQNLSKHVNEVVILKAVADFYGVSLEAMSGPARSPCTFSARYPTFPILILGKSWGETIPPLSTLTKRSTKKSTGTRH
jgi:chromosomal replication initiator protein